LFRAIKVDLIVELKLWNEEHRKLSNPTMFDLCQKCFAQFVGKKVCLRLCCVFVGVFCWIFVALICQEVLVDLCQKSYDVKLCDNECENIALC